MRMGKEGKKRALADVERALKADHPDPAKLLERKIICLEELGLFTQVQSPSISTAHLQGLLPFFPIYNCTYMSRYENSKLFCCLKNVRFDEFYEFQFI